MEKLLKECLEVAGWNMSKLGFFIVKHPNVWLRAVNMFQGSMSLKSTIAYLDVEVADRD